MIPKTTLTIVDGLRVVVPDSLKQITTYSVIEQQDWFEVEIKFLRKIIKPGEQAIDVGASYGLYTLTLAKSVGPAGKVWSFEPIAGTMTMLTESIAANGFSYVTLETKALSNSVGSARMKIHKHSECNAIFHDGDSADTTESVTTTTLDECRKKYAWNDIAFLKIDAEGEEKWILEGGRSFFEELSPLVQFELKEGTELRLDLVDAFAKIGYEPYRLAPGLELLVPFHPKAPIDSYSLNLFCCKSDRADRLAQQGYLIKPDEVTRELRNEVLEKAQSRREYDWRQTLGKLPYGMRLLKTWKETIQKGNSDEVLLGLRLYAMSHDRSNSPAARFIASETALLLFTKMCEVKPPYSRLANLARVANDFGSRNRAVHALWQLCCSISENRRADLSEPFLAPCARFDTIEPKEAVGSWLVASATEAYERLSSFSTFYTGSKALERLKIIADLGYGDEEMKRRIFLVRKCIEEFGETNT